jgi:hypothetical protein
LVDKQMSEAFRDIIFSFWIAHKQMSEEKLSSDDDKQLEEHKQSNVGETYDYLPQGFFFIYVYFCM